MGKQWCNTSRSKFSGTFHNHQQCPAFHQYSSVVMIQVWLLLWCDCCHLWMLLLSCCCRVVVFFVPLPYWGLLLMILLENEGNGWWEYRSLFMKIELLPLQLDVHPDVPMLQRYNISTEMKRMKNKVHIFANFTVLKRHSSPQKWGLNIVRIWARF